jgi:ribosomal protein S1
VGEVCQGKIIKIVDFGLFVELDGGVEGLVYASEYKDSPEFLESIHAGDAVEVRVLKVDPQERKIGLGIKGGRS